MKINITYKISLYCYNCDLVFAIVHKDRIKDTTIRACPFCMERDIDFAKEDLPI